MIATIILALAAPVFAVPASSFGGSHVRLSETNLCIDVTNGASAAISPVQLQLWDCFEGNSNQAWLHTSSGRAAGNPIVLFSGSQEGQCVGVTADGE